MSGLYGKTVDFGVAISGGDYKDAEYMFSWQKSGSGEWTNTEWQKDNWVHITITEKGHYDFFIRVRYAHSAGEILTKSLYWADQYCGGTYFTFAQSGKSRESIHRRAVPWERADSSVAAVSSEPTQRT